MKQELCLGLLGATGTLLHLRRLIILLPIAFCGIEIPLSSVILDGHYRGLIRADHDIVFVVNESGVPGIGYYMELNIGTPIQKMNVLLDTGSSDFAVAANPSLHLPHWFDPKHSSTLRCSRLIQRVRYQRGQWTGLLCSDLIHMPNSYTAESSPSLLHLRSHIALIQTASNFFQTSHNSSWAGILGLGFPALVTKPMKYTTGSIIKGDSVADTRSWFSAHPLPLFNRIVQAWNVPDLFSIQFCAVTPLSLTRNDTSPMSTGKLYMGGIPGSIEQSNVLYTPIHRPWYYEIVLTDLLIGERRVVDDCKELNYDKTILDTGTTNIYFPKRVYEGVMNQIHSQFDTATQAHRMSKLIYPDGFWSGNRLVCFQGSQSTTDTFYILFPSIEFQLQAATNPDHVISLILSPRQYIRYVGRKSTGHHCFAFGIQKSPMATVLGSVFFEGFLVVFDRKNLRIGITNTTCSTSQGQGGSHVKGFIPWNPPTHSATMYTRDCAFQRPMYLPWLHIVKLTGIWSSLISGILWAALTPSIFILYFFSKAVK